MKDHPETEIEQSMKELRKAGYLQTAKKIALKEINLEKVIFTNTDDEFRVRVAYSLEEACKLPEVGFEYVTDMSEAKLFRKRK